MYCDKSKLISVQEHYNGDINLPDSFLGERHLFNTFFPKNREDGLCFEIKVKDSSNTFSLKTGYFIGVDHIPDTGAAIYVAPKLNTKTTFEEENPDLENLEVDYLKMLFQSMQNPELFEDLEELFVIKWDEPEIELRHQKDFLTPFLVLKFLGILKSIVRKGLKKSYYQIEQNLNGRVKGKVLIGKTLKQNHSKSKHLSNVCSYEEFGINGIENRFLKKTLEFVKPYLESHEDIVTGSNLLDLYNFINPVFTNVSSQIGQHELKKVKTSSFYKEYNQAIDLAHKIFRRFGYNISENTSEPEITTTPPFWIDMSKLFEIYVLGLLRNELGSKVDFQVKASSNELDYVISGKETIIADAKYKAWYKGNREDLMTNDLRQVSGYARLKEIRKAYDILDNKVLKCLIIYPTTSGGYDEISRNDLFKEEMKSYFNIFKIGVNVPTVKSESDHLKKKKTSEYIPA